MTEEELILELKRMYENAANKKQVASIHLFGIKYVNELKNKNLKNIAQKATNKESYHSEINKGMNLSTLLFENNLLKKSLVPLGKSKNINIKNIILYGSPGVGKTHNTKKLISLIESGKSDKEIFEIIKNNELNDVADINDIEDRVKFVTFHQSFGYEDFIEGFRPDEEGTIGLEKGIFLEICKDAEENLLKSSEHAEITFADAFNMIFKEKIENEENVTFALKRAGNSFSVYEYNNKTIYFEKQSGNTNHTLSIATLEKMYISEKNHFINGGLSVYLSTNSK